MAWVALVTPFLSFAKDLIGYFRRPKLAILPFDATRDLRTWNLFDLARTQKAFTAEIRVSSGKVAKRCIAILVITKQPPGVTLPETHYTLHWADTNYSGRTSGAEPVDIGPEGRRLDVAFTHSAQQVAGCWIANPMALAAPFPNQAHLPARYYEGRIDVRTEYGDSASVAFRLRSPMNWADLDVETIVA